MNRLSSYLLLLLALATLCAGLPLARRDLDCSNSNDCIDYDSLYTGDSYATEYSSEKYLRIITPNSGTVWQADSYQSVTWAFDGSAHLGYSETVNVILLAVDNYGHWKKVDTLQSGTTGSGISNYHVRKDLGKAHAYKVVLEIEKVHFSIESEPFSIKSISGHSNEGDSYDDDSYGNNGKSYLRPITPNSQTVWDADSFQSATFSYDGSTNLGYGETVEIFLLALQSDGSWKKVDDLPSATTGSGISNYHVRKDLGKAPAYKVVFVIEEVDYHVESDSFKIQQTSQHSNEADSYDDNSYGNSGKSYLRPITPNSQTVWDADSYQSATWSYDGSSNLGYGETVEVFLFARQSDGSWKKVDELPSATTGSGISNYHVRKDLGRASEYIIVLVIDEVNYHVATEPFKIKQTSQHSNEGDSYDDNSYGNSGKSYLRPITPNSQTVWDADSFQSATFSYDGSTNLGYGETVEIFLLALQSDGSWKKVDDLPSATTGSGISNYHVRKDLGKAPAYKVVFVIEEVDYHVESDSFKIQQTSQHSNEADSYDDNSYGNSGKSYLRPITPNSQTVWDADSYQSATWSYDGSSNLGYGETVEVFLFARQSDGSWKKVDELPSATTGSGISNYHVRKDLGRASAYIIVLVIDKVNYHVATEPFKIKQTSQHSNEGDSYDDNSYGNNGKSYLRPITPNSQTVWDADSFQSATFSYDGSTNLGYGETVEIFLLALQSDGSWKKVDDLPSATTGSGISNYHVRKDLGKAPAYKVVFIIEEVDYHVESDSFKIQQTSQHSNEADSYDDNSYGNSGKSYLRPITPNSQTVWDADSYQSATWSYDGSSNLGYGETVEVFLFARQSDGSWKKVDELPSATTGSGISNYHVRKDLGKASAYIIVLVIDKVNYHVATEPFKIKQTSQHSNEGEDYNGNGSDSHNANDSSKYIAITSPSTQSVWKTGSDQTINWTYNGSETVKSDDKVRLTLFSYDTQSKSVKEVGDIGEWDVSAGAATYHIPDDLEIADYFVILFTFERIQQRMHSEPFKIEHS